MITTVLFDEIYVSILIPVGMPLKQSLAIRRIIGSQAFEQDLIDAIKHVFESYPSAKDVSITLSQ